MVKKIVDDEAQFAVLYTVPQVAELLGVHWQTVLTYIKRDKLAAIRLGNRYRVLRSELESFLEKNKKKQKRPTLEELMYEIDPYYD